MASLTKVLGNDSFSLQSKSLCRKTTEFRLKKKVLASLLATKLHGFGCRPTRRRTVESQSNVEEGEF